MDWVEDHIEVVVAVIFGVVALGVAVWAAFFQNKPKRLDYQVSTNVSILSTHALELGSKLQVTYLSQPIRDPRLVTVRIKNTGKLSVAAEDYVDPISIQYSANHPFEAFVTKESSPGICKDVYYDVLSETPTFRPPLMNAGEWFDVQLISDGAPGDITVASGFGSNHVRCRRWRKRDPIERPLQPRPSADLQGSLWPTRRTTRAPRGHLSRQS